MTNLATVNDVHILKLPNFVEAGSSLIVAESLAQISHTISRAFFVTSKTEQIRGNHAHRTCNQTLICVSGAVQTLWISGSYNGDLQSLYPSHPKQLDIGKECFSFSF